VAADAASFAAETATASKPRKATVQIKRKPPGMKHLEE
jgi:hypothetical protein